MQRIRALLKNNTGFLLAILLLVTCRSSLADWYHVPTGSMQPTIVEGDRIFVNKLAYQLQLPFSNVAIAELSNPEVGDIVVFESEAAQNRLIKRVIGIPGDVVSMHQNRLVINGKPVTYHIEDDVLAIEKLASKAHPIKGLNERNVRDTFAPVLVPEGHYLVMGDNRNNSADSRVYGFVPMHEIQGRANRVLYSLDAENFWFPRAERFFTELI